MALLPVPLRREPRWLVQNPCVNKMCTDMKGTQHTPLLSEAAGRVRGVKAASTRAHTSLYKALGSTFINTSSWLCLHFSCLDSMSSFSVHCLLSFKNHLLLNRVAGNQFIEKTLTGQLLSLTLQHASQTPWWSRAQKKDNQGLCPHEVSSTRKHQPKHMGMRNTKRRRYWKRHPGGH